MRVKLWRDYRLPVIRIDDETREELLNALLLASEKPQRDEGYCFSMAPVS